MKTQFSRTKTVLSGILCGLPLAGLSLCGLSGCGKLETGAHAEPSVRIKLAESIATPVDARESDIPENLLSLLRIVNQPH